MPNMTSLSPRKRSALWAVVIACMTAFLLEAVVVLQAEVGVSFAQIWAAEGPAISGASLLAEDVFIEKKPPVLKPVLATTIPNQTGLLLRNGLSSVGDLVAPNLVSVLLAGKEPEGVCNHWSRDTQAWAKGRGSSHHVCTGRSHEEINGGSRSVILNLGFQNLIGFSKILNPVLINSNVSAQLPFLGFLHDSKLLAASTYLVSAFPNLDQRNYEQSCGYKCVETNTDGYPNFQSKQYVLLSFLCISFFVVIFGYGYKRLVYDGQFFRGTAYLAFGWLTGLATIWFFIVWFQGHLIWPLAEYVSAADGIDASATCFSRADTPVTRPM
jgi:hypothetical protein